MLENIINTIGNTPLVKLHNLDPSIKAKVYAKLESMNPGDSAKDRIAKEIIEQAEKRGDIKAGATVIEVSSGNTGYSLAMVCAVKGYQCIITVTDKTSTEKIRMLQAIGAKVHICPSGIPINHPNSRYSQAKMLAETIPNSYYVNQYSNMDNFYAHYHTTGPEIWQQTAGKVTHYVACCGTGGTLTGAAKFLKEQNPAIQVIGVDAYGSLLKKYHETGQIDEAEIYSYTVEGLGQEFIPDITNFSVIDRFVKVTDAHSLIKTRLLAKQEGIMVGYSSGSALEAVCQIASELKPTDLVVVLFPDHGYRYASKVFNDEWVRKQKFYASNAEQIPALPEPVYVGGWENR